MENLNYYVQKYGSDKILSGYTQVYEPIFKNIRKEVKSVLEIGIGTLMPDIPSSFVGNPAHYPHYKPGGSLRAWRDYFENAQIYGIDVAEDCKFEEERISTQIFSSLDEELSAQFLLDKEFDIIIDDGLHTAEAQIKTLKNFFHKLKDNGIYAIEDCGGGGDATHPLVDKLEEFEALVKGHEYYSRGNIIFIKKNYSGKGEVKSFEDFSGSRPFLRSEEEILLDSLGNHALEIINSLSKEKRDELIKYISKGPKLKIINEDLTVVTGLWNINRPGRDFTHYIENFKKFLEIPVKMFIYIEKKYEYLVWEKRDRENTSVRVFELEDVKKLYSPFWEKTQQIRTDPEWFNQTGENGWLTGSPQAHLEWYNPIVQSKMFMLNDASILNPLNTEYFIWLDAGITNTVYEKYFTEHRVLDKINKHLDTFLFLSYPYETTSEIHGFDKKQIDKICGTDVKYVCRGGLFGGRKDAIHQANSDYYSILDSTLSKKLMGTEESVFLIMAYLNPYFYRRFELEGNGLIVKYITDLLNDTAKLVEIENKNTRKVKTDNPIISGLKTSLYMLTFNFPEQIEHTLNTFKQNSEDWINKPKKYLIDNSTNEEARIKNKEVADRWGFEHIIMNENKGINGGRLFAAEHFQNSDSDFYFFFEDDMGLYTAQENGFCRNGFRKYIPNLYEKLQKIMVREDFDFLKFSFTEVYMDNHIQVSWYNVPQVVRTRDFPDYDKLPLSGLDPHAPRTKFDYIDTFDGVSYISGNVYYANWPMIVGKKGNEKMFLKVKWQHPYEQTWMSYMYQEYLEGNLKPAVLLASPVNHNRIAYYKPEERREN